MASLLAVVGEPLPVVNDEGLVTDRAETEWLIEHYRHSIAAAPGYHEDLEGQLLKVEGLLARIDRELAADLPDPDEIERIQRMLDSLA